MLITNEVSRGQLAQVVLSGVTRDDVKLELLPPTALRHMLASKILVMLLHAVSVAQSAGIAQPGEGARGKT